MLTQSHNSSRNLVIVTKTVYPIGCSGNLIIAIIIKNIYPVGSSPILIIAIIIKKIYPVGCSPSLDNSNNHGEHVPVMMLGHSHNSNKNCIPGRMLTHNSNKTRNPVGCSPIIVIKQGIW